MSNPLLLFWYRLYATTEIVFVMVVRHTQRAGWPASRRPPVAVHSYRSHCAREPLSYDRWQGTGVTAVLVPHSPHSPA